MNNFTFLLFFILLINALLIKPQEEANKYMDKNSLENVERVVPIVSNNEENEESIEKRQLSQQQRQRRRRRRQNRINRFNAFNQQISNIQALISALQSQIAAITPAGRR
uniref:BZIP domain-containing protein n=1 Tax=Strongyloides stercoralis TaxID=6248 RepID=A0A0K0ECA0_STRER